MVKSSTMCFCYVYMRGARCSSVVRAFAHGAMGRIDHSWWSHFSFQPVHHNWFHKGCDVLSCLWDDAYKRTLTANRKEYPCGGSGFPLSLSGPMPYNRI